jgi:hypothetical protein
MQHPIFYCNTIYLALQHFIRKNAATAHLLEKYIVKNTQVYVVTNK